MVTWLKQLADSEPLKMRTNIRSVRGQWWTTKAMPCRSSLSGGGKGRKKRRNDIHNLCQVTVFYTERLRRKRRVKKMGQRAVANLYRVTGKILFK